MSKKSHGCEIVLESESLFRLISALQDRGYDVIVPSLRDSAIDWQPFENAESFPRGWTARQSPGSYRLARREDRAWFGYAAGPSGLKRFLHEPETRIFSIERNGNHARISENLKEPRRRAFVGVRACDLAALEKLDRVLVGDRYPDPSYQRARENIFLVAVSCSDPSDSCFCSSMGTGPEIQSGYDVLLTEIAGAEESRFIARAGSPRGHDVLAGLNAPKAPDELLRQAAAVISQGRERISRRLDMSNVRQALLDYFEHPEWERAAARCYGCANCTQVCPTCFCVTVEDTSDIDGARAERIRKWDSCFTLSYSYIHGGSVRQSPKARYRQWVTHKFASWQDQFGSPGCTGCGRCITWCPAGIDVTQVVSAVAGSAREPELKESTDGGR